MTTNQIKMEGANVIPQGWEALGVQTGYNPTPADDLRLWFVGPPGGGKTTFLSSIPGNLILDFERGANAIPGSKAARLYIKNVEHLDSVLSQLEADAKNGKPTFTRVTFDTIDAFHTMVGISLAKELNVEAISEYKSRGAGYALLANRCWNYVERVRQAGYSWACLGHLKEETVTVAGTNKEITRQRPVLSPSMSSLITRNADFFCAIHYTSTVTKEFRTQTVNGKEVKVPTGKEIVDTSYWLNIGSLDGTEAKVRGIPAINMKIKLPLIGGWEVFKDVYNKEIERIKQELENQK